MGPHILTQLEGTLHTSVGPGGWDRMVAVKITKKLPQFLFSLFYIFLLVGLKQGGLAKISFLPPPPHTGKKKKKERKYVSTISRDACKCHNVWRTQAAWTIIF